MSKNITQQRDIYETVIFRFLQIFYKSSTDLVVELLYIYIYMYVFLFVWFMYLCAACVFLADSRRVSKSYYYLFVNFGSVFITISLNTCQIGDNITQVFQKSNSKIKRLWVMNKVFLRWHTGSQYVLTALP